MVKKLSYSSPSAFHILQVVFGVVLDSLLLWVLFLFNWGVLFYIEEIGSFC